MTNKNGSCARLGVGLYAIDDAARLLRTRPAALRRWLDPDKGLVPRRLPIADRAISFVEFMELYLIGIFREQGVSARAIRRASAAAASKFGTDYPFAVKRFDTDGRTIFATLVDSTTDRQLVEDLRRGQYVFDQIMKPFFQKLDFRGGQKVARFWPMERKGGIVLDPERKFGKPIDADSGVPTRAIYNAVQAGGGQDQQLVARWFGVSCHAVRAAVAFEKSLP
ncbi:MAG: hypothetical protein ACREJM_06595 [Candidatus Saccharimonadales bacterium]